MTPGIVLLLTTINNPRDDSRQDSKCSSLNRLAVLLWHSNDDNKSKIPALTVSYLFNPLDGVHFIQSFVVKDLNSPRESQNLRLYINVVLSRLVHRSHTPNILSALIFFPRPTVTSNEYPKHLPHLTLVFRAEPNHEGQRETTVPLSSRPDWAFTAVLRLLGEDRNAFHPTPRPSGRGAQKSPRDKDLLNPLPPTDHSVLSPKTGKTTSRRLTEGGTQAHRCGTMKVSVTRKAIPYFSSFWNGNRVERKWPV